MYSYDRSVYSYDRIKVADVEELPALLREFGKIIEGLITSRGGPRDLEAAVEDFPDDYDTQLHAAVAVGAAFKLVKHHGIELLFYGLVQHYVMDRKDRKIIERASRKFAKGSQRRITLDKAVEIYKKALKEYRDIFEAAQRVVRGGKLHTEEGSETTMEAGPFMLINAGGFDAKKMETAQKVVEQAAKKLKSKGLGKVCYGSVQVTNTIGRSTRVLAFYLVNKDQMFVRANLRGKLGPAVMSVTHELGHRLHFKYLKSKDQQIQDIYDRIKGQEDAKLEEALEDPAKSVPPTGSTIQEGRKTWEVIGWERNFRTMGIDIKLVLQQDPERKVKARLPLRAWLKSNSSGSGVSFVSNYASTNHEENFAEMIAHYCEGLLPDDQVEMLKEVL